MAKLKFKETQRYQQWEVITLLALLSFGTAIRLGMTLISGGQSSSDNVLFGSLLLLSLLLMLAFFLKVRMKVKINAKGVNYSIFPWESNKQKIKWIDVASYELVNPPAQTAFSGWAVQYGCRTRGWNMGSGRGLRLHLQNGENYFLSIDNLHELEQTLEEIFDQQEVV